MAVAEVSSSRQVPQALPFEHQGVWKFSPEGDKGPTKLVWVPHLNQMQVDAIREAYEARQMLSPNEQPRDGIAVRVVGNSYIPTPEDLVQQPEASLVSIIRSHRNAKIINDGVAPNVALTHLLTMEFTRRIISSLEQFDDKRKNVSTLLTR